ncbi:hypothetical protein RclHR1_10700008 [Rhizophagus clarus]|uniref:Uncharacterized protein n=1 Tax=Rhizophagus clarus TaxID=94130 RepID=A0A2Z6Q2C2_9GLOM|nr:hypothetical protein RclHR1_10700008 [Rhizophagus clarus]GES73640.1 hypothetical protein RCL_e7745_RclHR1_10700008 [Rhizophagus clarus]
MLQLNVSFMASLEDPRWYIHTPFWFAGYTYDYFATCTLATDTYTQLNDNFDSLSLTDCIILIPYAQTDDDM